MVSWWTRANSAGSLCVCVCRVCVSVYLHPRVLVLVFQSAKTIFWRRQSGQQLNSQLHSYLNNDLIFCPSLHSFLSDFLFTFLAHVAIACGWEGGL